jgi:hypothetical protein
MRLVVKGARNRRSAFKDKSFLLLFFKKEGLA